MHKNQHPPGAKQGDGQQETTNRHVFIEPGVKIDLVDDLKDASKTQHGENKTQHDPITTRVGTPVSAKGYVTNSGKTPALKVSGRLVLRKVRNGDTHLATYNTPHNTTSAGIILAGGKDAVDLQWLDEAAVTHVVTPHVMGLDDDSEFAAARAYMGIYGVIAYTDVFGNHHWTRFCFWGAQSPGSEYTAKDCADYNDVDKESLLWPF